MRDLNSIFCVLSLLPSRNTMSSRGVFDAARDGSYFHPVPLFWKEKKLKKNEEKMGGRTLENLYNCRCAWKVEESIIAYVLVGTLSNFIFKQKLKSHLCLQDVKLYEYCKTIKYWNLKYFAGALSKIMSSIMLLWYCRK